MNEDIKRRVAFMLVITLLIPLFILKIPWYLLVLISSFDKKMKDLYQEMEDDCFNQN